MDLKSKLAAAMNRAKQSKSGPGDPKPASKLAVMRVQAVANRGENKLAKANKKLEKYVSSPKAPAATKEKYNYVKNNYLGGTYEGKDIKTMTDANYNDKGTDKFKRKADKALNILDKEEKMYDKLIRQKRSKG
jgi:hypothetical protein